MTSEIRRNESGHIGYEYREIDVPRELSSLCLDSYPCFGWEQDPNHETGGGQDRQTRKTGASGKKETMTLYFRRDRSICNKTELTRLQRNFDGCVAELQALERAKTTTATMAALVIGAIGTAFMAGSTFAVTASPPAVWLTILLAIPGMIGWICPYPLYRRWVRKKTAEIEPLKEQKYDEIETICERGDRLLH